MRTPDIIVVGVGRSGTSTIARVLQENLGVRMAFNWECPPWNPKGSYEEQKLIGESNALAAGKISPEDWLQIFSEIYSEVDGFVGIKQNVFTLLNYSQWEALRPKIVFRTFRPIGPTVDSMVRWRKPSNRGYWEDFYKSREYFLTIHLSRLHSFQVVRVNFTENISDSEIRNILIPWIKYLKDNVQPSSL